MEHRRNPRWRLHHLILAAILALSAFLNLYGLNQEGYGNEYYAAAVKSMLMNWHNFFFNSFDPNGFITIDKPPVDFWIQALFAWVFGFHGWALMLPQALAGIGSVALLYHLVRRVFGIAAGLIAALVMALTPIAVAVQRTNQVDGLLVFVMLLAAWCLFRALETRRLRWLMGVAVFIGLGFNIKMMEAYLMLPAVYLTYLLARRIRWRRKLLQLAAMTGVLAAVSFSWAVAVDATPASERPYVGSTQTNNEMELIFGYNGLERLTGQMHGASGANSAPMQAASSSSGSAGTVSSAREQAGAGTSPWRTGGTGGQATAERSGWLRGGMGGGGMFNTGRPGPLRLFQSELGGQIGWLLPIALVSLVALLRRVRWRRPLSRREQHAVFWAAWLLPMAVFFSIAGFFHQYYLITMAPGIAALTGAGFAQMWRDARANSRWRWVIPAAALVDFVYQVTLVLPYPQVRVPLIAGGAILLALFALAIWRALQQPTAHAPGFRPEASGFRPAAPNAAGMGLRRAGAAAGVAALLVAPGYWAFTPIQYGVNAVMPAAGPTGTFTRTSLPFFAATGQRGNFQPGRWAGRFSSGETGGSPGSSWNGAAGRRFGRGYFAGGARGYSGAFPGATNGGGFPGASGSANSGLGNGPDGSKRGLSDVQTVDSALIKYLERHYKASAGAYLVATQNANQAAPIILQTGLPVMAMGGFSGSDPAVTVQELQQLTQSGKLRYFLIQSSGRFGGQSQVTQWILQHCKVVPESAWTSSSASTGSSTQSAAAGRNAASAQGQGGFLRQGGAQLYEYTGSK